MAHLRKGCSPSKRRVLVFKMGARSSYGQAASDRAGDYLKKGRASLFLFGAPSVLSKKFGWHRGGGEKINRSLRLSGRTTPTTPQRVFSGWREKDPAFAKEKEGAAARAGKNDQRARRSFWGGGIKRPSSHQEGDGAAHREELRGGPLLQEAFS